MKNILIINGHEYYENAKGQLNQTLTNRMVEKLGSIYSIKTTIVEHGYDIKEEQEKFNWADVVIFQTPVYWFNYPGACKTYIDAVYEHGIFYRSSELYGTGGLLEGKQYMLSVTWAAGEDVFSNHNQPFLEEKSVDEVLIAMHKTHQYVGMKPLKTLSNHSAYQPDIEKILSQTDKHLKEVFSI
ncbi:TPA: NAD(P)H-dependent oxidoreductase [Bacillus cereus]